MNRARTSSHFHKRIFYIFFILTVNVLMYFKYKLKPHLLRVYIAEQPTTTVYDNYNNKNNIKKNTHTHVYINTQQKQFKMLLQ